MHDGMHDMMDPVGIGWLLGLLLLFALLAAVIVVVVYGIRAIRDQEPANHGRRESRPADILGRRLAVGEIDVEEYHERLSALRSQSAA